MRELEAQYHQTHSHWGCVRLFATKGPAEPEEQEEEFDSSDDEEASAAASVDPEKKAAYEKVCVGHAWCGARPCSVDLAGRAG